jgi:hypothetical protein
VGEHEDAYYGASGGSGVELGGGARVGWQLGRRRDSVRDDDNDDDDNDDDNDDDDDDQQQRQQLHTEEIVGHGRGHVRSSARGSGGGVGGDGDHRVYSEAPSVAAAVASFSEVGGDFHEKSGRGGGNIPPGGAGRRGVIGGDTGKTAGVDFEGGDEGRRRADAEAREKQLVDELEALKAKSLEQTRLDARVRQKLQVETRRKPKSLVPKPLKYPWWLDARVRQKLQVETRRKPKSLDPVLNPESFSHLILDSKSSPEP